MRTLGPIVLILILLAGTVVVDQRLDDWAPADPLGKRLLYVPSLPALKLLSLGNHGLMASLLYLWSIQYYSQFQFGEHYLYLAKMLDLVTDLDPLYRDPYQIGGILMGMSAREDGGRMVEDVIALYDKGLENRPDDIQLAHFAAWDAYESLGRREDGIRYMEHAASIPEAPNRIHRVLGVWKDRNREWSLEDSVRHWEEALLTAENQVDLRAALSHYYDARTRLDRRTLDPALFSYRIATGRCATSWQNLVDAGLVDAVPMDAADREYGIDPDDCTLIAHKKLRID
jgi:tetratricopeptide (TPR) repeat protein